MAHSARLSVITTSTNLVTEECCQCHILFAIPEEMYERCQKDPNLWFYCPNGHHQHYSGATSDAAKLRKQLEAEKRRTEAERAAKFAAQDQAVAAERAARAYKGQATKIRRRVLRGVCPFCNRSFENVSKHMSTKHADRLDEEGVHLEHDQAAES